MTENFSPTPDETPTQAADQSSIPLEPAAVAEAARNLDPTDQAQLLGSIMTSVSMQGTLPDPVQQKITEEHISTVIQATADRAERDYQLMRQRENRRDSNRWFALAVFILVLLFAAFVCWFFQSSPDQMEKVLTGIFAFGAGAAAGFGFGRSRPEQE